MSVSNWTGHPTAEQSKHWVQGQGHLTGHTGLTQPQAHADDQMTKLLQQMSQSMQKCFCLKI